MLFFSFGYSFLWLRDFSFIWSRLEKLGKILFSRVGDWDLLSLPPPASKDVSAGVGNSFLAFHSSDANQGNRNISLCSSYFLCPPSIPGRSIPAMVAK